MQSLPALNMVRDTYCDRSMSGWSLAHRWLCHPFCSPYSISREQYCSVVMPSATKKDFTVVLLLKIPYAMP